jgi:uncharacterized protein
MYNGSTSVWMWIERLTLGTTMTQAATSLPFLERYHELRALAAFYQKGWHRGAGFLLLSGRKGMGQCRLLHEFLQEEAVGDVFTWQALPGDAALQLQAFSQALLRYDSGPISDWSPDFSFFDWEEALDHLAQIAETSTGTKLFILEGFTDLCHNQMGMSSYLQHAWDGRLKEIRNLRLIISGSPMSTVIREVLAYSAPLYFRCNHSLYLKPLRYTAVLDLLPGQTPEERLAVYTVTGGMPAYLRYFASAPDVTTATEALCFEPDSTFLADMETLFGEQIENAPLCRTILTAVAEGCCTLDGLSKRLEMAAEDLEDCLYWLRLVGLLDENRSVHERSTSRRLRYSVAEPSLHFTYRHLKPALDTLRPKEAVAAAVADLYRSLGGRAFAGLCRDWLWAAAVTEELDLMPGSVGAYWRRPEREPEFPIAAADPWQKKLLVGDLFWQSEALTPARLKQLVRNSKRLPQVRKEGWTVAQIVFSRTPFTAEVQAVAAAANVRLVGLAEMEQLLLAARRTRRRALDQPVEDEIPF